MHVLRFLKLTVRHWKKYWIKNAPTSIKLASSGQAKGITTLLLRYPGWALSCTNARKAIMPATMALDSRHVAGNKELPTELEQQFKQYWLTAKISPKMSLLQQGTEFQQKVWRALCLIPIDQTTSYGELAQKLGTAPRALANACRKNPFPLIIPCHRVLAKTGIGGYAGATTGKLINIKLALLQHEQMITHDF
ncbi:methylated-DNA-[protein]-cysteine S-methyltransferase [Bathymodiolus platifrons methanotrophic gill symbiont]|nr:methylated-DNA-[protein]-cysteine S-methyltransferase [Bathymodiolus platifrons methanotrophic gill symbiont]GFO74146.1 methylated-DNA-[protein]-cysteine S-methyltransferase [Bathymodiolus platifrons methanotrophic gill symbiont]